MSLLDGDRFRVRHSAQLRIIRHIREPFLKFQDGILPALLKGAIGLIAALSFKLRFCGPDGRCRYILVAVGHSSRRGLQLNE